MDLVTLDWRVYQFKVLNSIPTQISKKKKGSKPSLLSTKTKIRHLEGGSSLIFVP